MITEKQLYKAVALHAILYKNGNSQLISDILNDINIFASKLCEPEKPSNDPDYSRDRTVAPGRILISDERLRQIKMGHNSDAAQVDSLFDKIQKRVTNYNPVYLSYDEMLKEMVQIGALIAAEVDRLLLFVK